MKFEFQLNIPGATTVELERGMAAAQAVLDAHGLTGPEVLGALDAMEIWDMNHFAEDARPAQKQFDLMSVYLAADNAAVDACCKGWPREKVHGQVLGWLDLEEVEALQD